MAIHKNKVSNKKIDAKKDTLCEGCDHPKGQLERKSLLNNIIGRSKAIQELHEKINLVSTCNVNVLISGDSGTGKELTARAIHCLSSRASRPFIPVNCGAIPENLFENELFGHVKGAFTDACFQQNGLIEAAEGGTLFLDEICDVNSNIQIKFLRFLEDKEYKLLGDIKPHKANIRIIAATNRNLFTLVQEGKFREDLFYRLNIVSIDIPPLRERRDDITLLSEYFLKKYSAEFNKNITGFSSTAMEKLIMYKWPGNVRELENTIQRAIVLSASSVVKSESIIICSQNTSDHGSYSNSFKLAKGEIVRRFEVDYLRGLLSIYKGNITHAAVAAKKDRRVFYQLMEKHSIKAKEFK